MPAPTFEVPESGNYTDSLTGARIQVIEGDFIDLDLAVRLGLTGAVAPRPEAAEVLYAPNMIPNGTFEDGITGWLGGMGTETLAHETDVPMSGTGSLSVDTTAVGESVGLEELIDVEDYEILAWSFIASTAVPYSVECTFLGATQVVLAILTGDEGRVQKGGILVVPPAARKMGLSFTVIEEEGGGILLDDIFLARISRTGVT